MDTKYLNYIITIAEEQNMTKAAEKLFVSQSSLSYTLSKLEQEIGIPLFVRAKNRLIPTSAGNMYIDAAHKVIDIKSQLYQNMRNLENHAHLSISTTSHWGNKLFADLIPGFKTAFPNMTFSLSQIDVMHLKKEVLNGTVDIALMSIGSMDELDDMTELLRKEELQFAIPAGHPYLASSSGDTITQQEILDCFLNDTFLVSGQGTANRHVFDKLFSGHNATPPRICEITGINLTNDMIAAGTGVGLIPISASRKEDLVRYYSFEPKLYRYNVMVHRKNLVLNEPEQAFFNLVKNYFGQPHSS